MKKLKLFFACLLMAVLSIGQVWAAEEVYKTALFGTGYNPNNSGYSGSFDATNGTFVVTVTNFNNNNNGWSGTIKCGSKNAASVASISTKAAIDEVITKVVVTFGTVTAAKVNSVKLYISSDGSTWTEENSFTVATGAQEAAIESGNQATNLYYKVEFDCQKGTANGFVALSKVEYYHEVSSVTCANPTFSPAAGTFYGSQEITLATATTGASIYYTTDGTTPSSTNGTLYEDPFEISSTTTVKAIAVKDGATDSGIAEATYTAGEVVTSYNIDFETNNLAAYVNWDFVNIKCASATIAAHGGSYYGNTDGKASASIATKAKIATLGALTFWTSKESANTTASSWKAQVSEDGEAWTDVETFDATTGNKGTWTEREADLSTYSDVYVRIAYSGSTAIRAIDDISLSTTPSVVKPTISGSEKFVNTTEVTITHATADAIYYTIDGSTPTTGSTAYSAPFSLSETATVKAIAVKGGESSPVASKEFTKITPITVAEAIAAIPNADDVVNDQYVSGIVCTAGTSVSSGQMTYYISDDGSETNRLEIYKGKNINNTNFTNISNLALGDRVVVFGQLKNFNGTPEMNSGNYLISKEAPAIAAPVFSPDGGGFMGETDVTITCATGSSTIYYTTDGTNPSKSSTPYTEAIHINATTTIKAIAYVGDDASVVITKTFTLTAPMTVAEALTALDSESPINNVAVAGIISTAPTANPSSGRLTYYISDDGTTTNQLEVFNGYGLSGASFSNKTDLQVGDEVTVFGNLTIYNSTTKEFSTGSRLLAFNRPAVAVTDIDLTESTAEVEVGSTVALHASVVPGNATDQDIVWSVTSGSDKASVDENGVVTGLEEGEATIRAAAHEDESIYEECTVTVNAASAPLTDYYEKVTSGDVAEGTYLIVYETGSLAFNGGLTTLDASGNTIAVDITNDNKIGVTTETEAATFYIDPTAGTIKAANGKYIGQGSNANGLAVSDDALVNTLSIDGDGNAVIVSAGGAYLRYNATSGQERFRYFKSSSYTGQKAIQLYKLANEVVKADPGISWDPESAELTLTDYITTGDYPEPVLIIQEDLGANPLESITLSSDNESLATINKTNDGQIKISWVPDVSGTVHFTASYPGNETYKAVTATCTIKVNPDPASLSPWATVYTSNITLSTEGGTSASVAKVKFDGEETEYAAIKAGTGSVAGAVVVSVPAGATALHFHAYSWYNETVELTVSAPTGVTVTPSAAIGINQNSGISNNSPFTLEDGSTPQFDAYYAVSLSGNSEPIALTISATSGKRFVLFGVNQEGGLVLESISVGGTASVLEYTDGQHFDPTGLSVTGHYSDASTAPITEDIVWAFDPDPLTEGTTSVSVTATAGGFTSAAFVVNGLTVGSAAPLSPWATVYTSNITLSTEGGTSASAAKVKFYGEEGDGYDAIKAGTGSVQGAVVVNVPAQATALHFHAYSWNTEDVELTVTAPAGVTVTPSSAIAINKNSGIASNSPFTLAEGSTPQYDAYYAVSLSGNTEPIALTISATSGKRFVLFGVNQEGGILPVLKSIEITGDATKLEYEDGDEFNPAGLGVNAIYTLNDVDQEPVAVAANDIEWSYDPATLTIGTTSVTVTATVGDKSANKVVNGLNVVDATPEITTQPANYVNFTVTKDDAVPAAKTITVSLKNVAAATADLGGDNPGAFSINKTDIADGDEISVSVVSTATVGTYVATVTISDNAGVAANKVVTINLTVKAPEVAESPVSTTSKWVPATEIADGMQVLIVGVNNDYYAMGAQTNNNRTAVQGSVDGDVFTPGANTMAFTVVAQDGGTYALRTSNGKYLYAASSSSNWLRSQDELDDNGKWNLTVSSAAATGSNTRNTMFFNSGNSIFSCYASTTTNQKAIALYVPQTTPPTKDLIRGGLSNGKWGTLCPKQTVENVEGAVFYQISYLEEQNGLPYNMVFDQIEGTTLTAGQPYFFIANATEIRGNKTGDAVSSGSNKNGFYGYIGTSSWELPYVAEYNSAVDNTFVIYNNSVFRINQEGTMLQSERCYILINATVPSRFALAPVPGRHRVTMNVSGAQETQGVDNLNASEKPVKMMIDGQLFIIRGEKMFDATGRLVK